MTSYKPDPNGWAALERAVAYGLLNLAFAIEADAKAAVPYRTGNLRRSIHSAAFRKGQRIYGATDDNGRAIPQYAAGGTAMAVVGTNTGYGVFVELGTVKMAAQPYLGPALNANRGRASELVLAGIQRNRGK